MEDRILESKEVLALLDNRITYGELLSLVRQKRIRATKVGNKLRFAESSVRAWLRKELGVA
jgi:excisionase family DNA binding protein